MIKRFFAWLKSIYFKPAAADIKTPEVVIMSEPLVDEVATPAAAPELVPISIVVEQPAAPSPTPAPVEEVKAGVADFEAALSFVESGVAQLGEAAKDELKELAKKYL